MTSSIAQRFGSTYISYLLWDFGWFGSFVAASLPFFFSPLFYENIHLYGSILRGMKPMRLKCLFILTRSFRSLGEVDRGGITLLTH